MQHHFDVDVAMAVGVIPAVILNHFQYWIEKNKANDTNFFDDHYWTFNSMKAMKEIFPYLTDSQIRTNLDKLVEGGYLIKGNYNKSTYDRTLWYALSENRNSICQNSQMDLSKFANGFVRKDRPIPNNETNNNTDINKTRNTRFIKPTIEEVRQYSKEKNLNLDAEDFWNYYESKGWVVGKSPMKNWHSAASRWASNQKEFNSSSKKNHNKDYDPNANDWEAETIEF